MKNTLYCFILLLFLIASCSKQKNTESKSIITEPIQPTSSIVKKDITNEIYGSAYRKRATSYSAVVNKDTSDFAVIFSEDKEGGKVRVIANYNTGSRPYETRMKELEKILPVAKNDYSFDSLVSIQIGRLVNTGDLAIDVSKEFIDKYGSDFKIDVNDYREIANFLSESKMGRDINKLIAPYSREIDKVQVEKVFFIDKESINSSEINHTKKEIPEKILDCSVWVELVDK